MRRTVSTNLPVTVAFATALSLIGATPVSADGLSLGEQVLSLDTGEPLLLRLDTANIIDGDDASGVWLLPEPPPSEQDRRRAHRGSVMTAFGVPLLASGVGALIWAATVSSTNDCGDERSRKPYVYGGLAMTTVGVGFSTAGLVPLLRVSKKARRPKPRRTRAATGVAAFFGTALGAATLGVIGLAGGFCST